MPAPRRQTEAVTEHEVRAAASPEGVFEHFTDPAKMVQRMGTEATLDPRPGGVCRINPSGQAAQLAGAPARAWAWAGRIGATGPDAGSLARVATPARRHRR
jgi:hypothetical protein